MSSLRASIAPAWRARASEQNVNSRRPSMETHHRSGSTRSTPTTWPLTSRSVYAGFNLMNKSIAGRRPSHRCLRSWRSGAL